MLSEKKILKQSTSLPNSPMNIQLEAKQSGDIDFQFLDNAFLFSIPYEYVMHFGDKHRIGFSKEIGDIEIIIEKDLPSKKGSKS